MALLAKYIDNIVGKPNEPKTRAIKYVDVRWFDACCRLGRAQHPVWLLLLLLFLDPSGARTLTSSRRWHQGRAGGTS